MCCMFSLARRLVSEAAQITTQVTQDTGPTMAPGRITVEAQLWSLSEIDLIIEVPGIRTAARIMSGGQDTGAGGTANTSGSVGTTWYADTKKACFRKC